VREKKNSPTTSSKQATAKELGVSTASKQHVLFCY